MGSKVQLFVYDLSGGLARSLSSSLLGQQIDGVWHTSIVVDGHEHYFGGGINVAPAGSTPFGVPVQVVDLGATQLPPDVRDTLLVDLSERYTPESYSLLNNNCNNFSDELAQLLTGRGIPPHITGLPQAVLATPFGQMLRPMLTGLEAQMRSMRSQAFVPHHASSDPTAPAPALPLSCPPTPAAPSSDGSTPAAGAAPSTAPDAIMSEADGPVAAVSAQAGGAAEGQEAGAISPALLAVEKELEAAVAEGAMADLKVTIQELDLKEGRATPDQQLGPHAAERLATEAEVKREYERVMAAAVAAGETINLKEAEARAVERVAAAHRAAEAAEARAAQSQPGS